MLQKFPQLAFIPNASGRLPIEVALTSGRTWHSGVRELVQANPNCLSQVDRILGLYPFQLAAQVSGIGSEVATADCEEPLRKKRKRVHEEDADASKETTSCQKSNADDEEASLLKLDTIFHLLRQCPSLVKFAES